jgi:hypothetical protein
VIAVTLNFRSIEAAREVLLQIPENALVGATAAPAQAPEAPAQAPKPPRAAKPAATSPATVPSTDAPAATAPTPAADTTPPAAAHSVEYPVLQKAVFALAAKSRDAAAAVAQSFGVKTFKDLDPARWPEALGVVQEKLAELEG